jgi:hypothetical protein
MNYLKIYDQFILDRKTKEPELIKSGDYCERHHIKPKCIGGDDSKENLISLSACDHYFAHLILAKIYGGKLWFAVTAMANMDNGTKRGELFKQRVKFSHIRKAISKEYALNFSRENGARTDHKIHHFKNFDGATFSGKRYEIEEQTGLPRKAVCALILGEKLSYNGWYCMATNPKGKSKSDILSEKQSSNEVFNLFHYDGNKFTGTRKEFREKFGKRLGFSEKRNSCYGWYKSEIESINHKKNRKETAENNAKKRGKISGLNNPRADHSKYAFENEKTGEILHTTRAELAKKYGIKSSAITSIIKGYQVAAGEWKLKGVERQRRKTK